ncbi:MAG: hypothetical protein ACK56I_20690 [bacterium]
MDRAISHAKISTKLLYGVQSVRRTHPAKLCKANATTESIHTVAAVLALRPQQLELEVAEYLLFGGTFVVGDLGG